MEDLSCSESRCLQNLLHPRTGIIHNAEIDGILQEAETKPALHKDASVKGLMIMKYTGWFIMTKHSSSRETLHTRGVLGV